MRILSIHMYKWLEDNAALLCGDTEVGFAGYFERKVLREHLNFHSRVVTSRSRPGERTAIHLENNVGIAYVAVHPNLLGVCVITDIEYP
jgi:synaptobrevin family protein YKT6